MLTQAHEAILNCMGEAVYVIDRSMKILYANPASAKLTGYTVHEAIGKKCEDIFCEASFRCKGICPPKKAMREQQPILHREAETKTKGGDIRQTQISFSPFYEDEKCVGSVIVIKDITEVKKAEEQLRKQKDFLMLIIDSLPHPFYVIDANNYAIRIANKAGMSETPAAGQTCFECTHSRNEPCDETEHPCPLAEVKKSKLPVVVEHIHRDHDGALRNCEVHGCPIVDDKGDVVQMIEYSLDITDRKNADLQREGLIGELRQALDQVNRLSGLLPICSSCKKIRDDGGYWTQIETYISEHSEAQFSHGLCLDCARKLYPSLYKGKE